MSKTRKVKEQDNSSMYTRSINLPEDDPLEEIFALNLGDFLTEHLIFPHSIQSKHFIIITLGIPNWIPGM